MNKEKIDLTTTKEGDEFELRGGNVAIFVDYDGEGQFPYNCTVDGSMNSYKQDGSYVSAPEHSLDIIKALTIPEQEPSEQEVFNTNTKKALSELTSALEGIQARDRILARLLEFNEGRLGSADRKIDILMGERSTPKMGEVKELPKYYNEPVSMSWYDALTKYEDHPDYRMMTKEELLDEYEDNPNNLLDAAYWCSDEWSKSYAHSLRGGNGSTYAYEKRYPLKVRVVSREMVDCEINIDFLKESAISFAEAIDEYLESSKTKNTIISDALDRIDASSGFLDQIKSDGITPLSLLELGFTERYQGAMEGSEGYIYYEFELNGIALLSEMTSKKPFFVFLEDQTEIHSLTKLKNFISALESF